jgi:hypothetical protein
MSCHTVLPEPFKSERAETERSKGRETQTEVSTGVSESDVFAVWLRVPKTRVADVHSLNTHSSVGLGILTTSARRMERL